MLAAYHDTEWGVPVYDDRLLFEMLTLEGAQAGLSWDTVLRKRQGYKRAFLEFDVAGVAAMTDAALEALRDNPEIIRNRLKIYSTRSNALGVLVIQREFGSFSDYLWRFVDGRPIVNNFANHEDVPASTPLSDDRPRESDGWYCSPCEPSHRHCAAKIGYNIAGNHKSYDGPKWTYSGL